MTVLYIQLNAATFTLRCDRCGQTVWRVDAHEKPPAPHICPDCWTDDDESQAPLLPGSAPAPILLPAGEVP